MTGAPTPLPGLTLSAGPANAEALSGGGSNQNGDFFFKSSSEATTLELVLPYVVLGVLAWTMLRR